MLASAYATRPFPLSQRDAVDYKCRTTRTNMAPPYLARAVPHHAVLAIPRACRGNYPCYVL